MLVIAHSFVYLYSCGIFSLVFLFSPLLQMPNICKPEKGLPKAYSSLKQQKLLPSVTVGNAQVLVHISRRELQLFFT